MTDRAFAYTQAHAFQHVLGHLGARHRATRPYRPQTNGKTKRFIKTLLDEWWAYARLYRFNAARLETLPDWLATYNYHRAHTALAGQTPMRVLVNKAGGDHSWAGGSEERPPANAAPRRSSSGYDRSGARAPS